MSENQPDLFDKMDVNDIYIYKYIYIYIYIYIYSGSAVKGLNPNQVKGTPWDETFSMLSILKI